MSNSADAWWFCTKCRVFSAIVAVIMAVALLNGPLLGVALRLVDWSAWHEYVWGSAVALFALGAVLAVWLPKLRSLALGVASVLLVTVEAKLIFFGIIAAAFSTTSLPPHFRINLSCAFALALIVATAAYLDRWRWLIVFNGLAFGIAAVISVVLFWRLK